MGADRCACSTEPSPAATNAISGTGSIRPRGGLPLEGVLGNGDSGGPLLIEDHGTPEVVGLGSWITAVPEHALEAGFYGQVVYNVRVSRYLDWIEGVIERDASR